MFSPDPKSYIYSPPLMIFGGVRVEKDSSLGSYALSELSQIVGDVTSSFSQAYELRDVISLGEKLIVKISPLEEWVDEKSFDMRTWFDANNKPVRQKALEKIENANKNKGVFISSPDKVFYIYKLDEKFSHEDFSVFLPFLQNCLIMLAGMKGFSDSMKVEGNELIGETVVFNNYNYL